MSKRADDDTRTEALCRYCGQTILPRRIQIALLASNIPPHEQTEGQLDLLEGIA